MLNQILVALNDEISSEEKAAKLDQLKRLCEEAIANKLNIVEDRKVFVCDFSKLQFPKGEEVRSVNHVPVR